MSPRSEVGLGTVFAIAEVISGEPYEPAVTHEWESQWPWAVDTRIIAKKQRLSEAPSILVLGSTPDRRHRGHVPSTAEQVEKAEEAIR